MKSPTVLLLILLLVAVQPPVTKAFVFTRTNKVTKSMFYNPGYIEVMDARIRMGLHIPSEKDEFNTWCKKFASFV
uniref:Uncharacterized protein n=1 Tax=Caenorhabditis tropicalis TaxID=1561998 RepID=A0A1I7T4A3_9PELO